jgi:hypothetical protein
LLNQSSATHESSGKRCINHHHGLSQAVELTLTQREFHLRYRSFAGKSDNPVVAHAATSSVSLIDDFLFAVAASLKENRTLCSVDVMPHSTVEGLRALALAGDSQTYSRSFFLFWS